MKTYILIFLLTSKAILLAQYPGWLNYTNGENINSTVIVENYLWIGTDGGLVKINLITEESTFFNVANSGLLNNKINCIISDSAKNLWIGTDGGLCIFDRQFSWTCYTPLNSDLPEYYINTLRFDKNNNLWLGTMRGLIKFNGSSWTTIFDTPYRQIDAMEIDNDGNIWIGSRGNLAVSGYLAKFDGSTFTKYDESNTGQYFMQVYCILIDDSNSVWVGHDNGLVKFSINTWLNISNIKALCLVIDTNKVLWAGGFGGITTINKGNIKSYYEGNSPITSDLTINNILFNNDRIILGTTYKGLFFWEDPSFKKIITSNSSLPFNEIWGISFDSSQNTWFATSDGIAKFDGNNWTAYKFYDMDIYGPIFNTAFDGKANMWVGTWGDGVLKYDGTKWINYNSKNSDLQGDLVDDILIDSSVIWFGTWGKGLAKFINGNWETFNSSNSPLPDDYIRALAIDHNKILWIGTDKGLASFDGTNWNTYNNNQIPNLMIWDISIDKYGNKWLATEGSGLVKFNDNKWEVFNELNSGVTDKYLYSVSVDKYDNKWIGTRFSGLVKYHDSTWISYNIFNSGMPGSSVRSIKFDQDDNVYIGTSGGLAIYKYDPETGVITHTENNTHDFQLNQNYPNPFNPTTNFEFRIPNFGFVTLKIYDILGNEVANLVNEEKPAGEYKVEFDGSEFSSGVYFYKLTTNNYSNVKKMIILK